MLKTIVEKLLRFFSRRILKKYHPDVIAVTGSVGKTSTKEICLHVLGTNFKVHASPDSYNTRFGLPLTVIGKKSPGRSFWGWLGVFLKAMRLWLKRDKNYPEILLLEMAARRPGDLEYLTKNTPYFMAVVTSVLPVHLQFFKTMKKITQEERIVVSRLSKTGFAILNRDEGDVYELRKKTGADIITYGFHPEADVRTADVNLKLDSETGWPQGLMFKVIYKGSVVPMYLEGVMGEHSVYSVLAAISVALAFGINLVDISRVLQEVVMPPGRMRLLPGIKGTFLIDDSYNASPAAMKAALESLSQCPVGEKGERYAVLGNMLELGNQTNNSHREAGLRVAELGINFLITVGEAMKVAAQSAQEAGMPEHQTASFSHVKEAGKFLQEKIKSGDAVLIKGSRAMGMERIVKEVMAEPLKADELLIR